MNTVKGCKLDDPNFKCDIFSYELKNDLVKKASISYSKDHIIEEMTPVSNQGTIGSCSSNAICDAAEILMGLQKKEVVQLSRLFLYYNSRIPIKSTNVDDGAYMSDALMSLKNQGVCREELFPYLTENVYKMPNLKAYKEAFDNKISNFYKITSSDFQKLDDIEFAIKSNHPVVFSTMVSKAFTQANGDFGVWDFPSDKNSIEGRHAMIMTGVRYLNNGEREFRWRSSWGYNWGNNNGHVWVKESYIKNPLTADLYVLTYIHDLVF